MNLLVMWNIVLILCQIRSYIHFSWVVNLVFGLISLKYFDHILHFNYKFLNKFCINLSILVFVVCLLTCQIYIYIIYFKMFLDLLWLILGTQAIYKYHSPLPGGCNNCKLHPSYMHTLTGMIFVTQTGLLYLWTSTSACLQVISGWFIYKFIKVLCVSFFNSILECF